MGDQTDAVAYDGYNASMFTAFFAKNPMPDQLKAFKHSLVPQVQMFWDQADERTIKTFTQVTRDRGNGPEPVRLILRMLPQVLSRDTGRLVDEAGKKQDWAEGNIIAAQLGNEPDFKDDNGKLLDLRWRTPDHKPAHWGNVPPQPNVTSYWQDVALRVYTVSNALRRAGRIPNLISPSLMSRSRTGDDAAMPGWFTIRELVAFAWYGYSSGINGNGAHDYDNGWWERDPQFPTGNGLGGYSLRELTEYANTLVGARLATFSNVETWKKMVQFWSGYHHHKVWFDESNTFNSRYTPEQHMEGCIGKSKLLAHGVNAEGYRLGERVAMYSPFLWTGFPGEWPAQYIMDTPGCIELQRQHMLEEGYHG